MTKKLIEYTAICIFLACGLLLWSRLHNPPSYIAFTFHRSQKFYSDLADACDALITKFDTGIIKKSDLSLRGDDPRLPAFLLKLKADRVGVETNKVWLGFDSWAGYAVAWEQDYVNSNAWVLISQGETEPNRLFVRTNTTEHPASHSH